MIPQVEWIVIRPIRYLWVLLLATLVWFSRVEFEFGKFDLFQADTGELIIYILLITALGLLVKIVSGGHKPQPRSSTINWHV